MMFALLAVSVKYQGSAHAPGAFEGNVVVSVHGAGWRTWSRQLMVAFAEGSQQDGSLWRSFFYRSELEVQAFVPQG